MKTILIHILDLLKMGDEAPRDIVGAALRAANQGVRNTDDHVSKRQLMAYYQKLSENAPEELKAMGISDEINKQLRKLLQVKPGRTASGVAIVTVLTKPWTCSNECVYCPNDLTMPKSYQRNEPACQRAADNYFDPYLQVEARLRALRKMGHIIDKVELIVLGGTWDDYPKDYQLWFITELFRAVNESDESEESRLRAKAEVERRTQLYKEYGIPSGVSALEKFVEPQQPRVNNGEQTYNKAFSELYTNHNGYRTLHDLQTSTQEELEHQQKLNETSPSRVVGLVLETRPDIISAKTLTRMRQFGCTKVQIGIQNLNADILAINNRTTTLESIERAFSLLRLFGFKILAHTMPNLMGATPESDEEDYRTLVTDPRFIPDEMKLYPTVLLDSAHLFEHKESGAWVPYPQDVLVNLLKKDLMVTPPFIRVSRMIRDFPSPEIVAGNKTVNLRQLVENEFKKDKTPVQEIRFREIRTQGADETTLTLDEIPYQTAVSNEVFLQWITPENKIAGFLRLSLPNQDIVLQHRDELSIEPGQAMIREVHIYGEVSGFEREGQGAQHLGLGRMLIKRASKIAAEHGYQELNVISSVGTREYYRKQGFKDNGLYQTKQL